jgi:hypothetical protein
VIVFLVHVADYDLPLLLEALGSLDAELARIHYAVRDLAAWPAAESPDVFRARAAIRRAFAAVRTMRGLMVMPTEHSVETRAFALRARGIVISLQLVELRHADVREIVAAAGTSLEGFVAYVMAQIGRANMLWVGRPDDEDALARAERAFDLVGRDPLVSAVLAHGRASRDGHVRATCATLAALLGGRAESNPASVSTACSCREVG